MTMVNSINNFQYTTLGGINLGNYKFPKSNINNCVSGNNDFYTCPAGKKCAIYGVALYNDNASSRTVFFQVKISGTYYRLSSQLVLTTGLNSRINTAYILEAGDIVSLNSTGVGVNAWGKMIEFDARAPVSTKKILSLSNGDNTLYTVPNGKTALVLCDDLQSSSTNNYSNMTSSTSNPNITCYSIPNGGTKGTSNQISPSTFINTNTRVNFACNPTMNSGDFYVMNTTNGTATQFAWMNVIEI